MQEAIQWPPSSGRRSEVCIPLSEHYVAGGVYRAQLSQMRNAMLEKKGLQQPSAIMFKRLAEATSEEEGEDEADAWKGMA